MPLYYGSPTVALQDLTIRVPASRARWFLATCAVCQKKDAPRRGDGPMDEEEPANPTPQRDDGSTDEKEKNRTGTRSTTTEGRGPKAIPAPQRALCWQPADGTGDVILRPDPRALITAFEERLLRDIAAGHDSIQNDIESVPRDALLHNWALAREIRTQQSEFPFYPGLGLSNLT